MKTFSFLFFSLLFISMGPATAADVQEFTVGRAKVIAIQDLPSEVNASLFKEVDEGVLKQTMPAGKAPSSISTFLVILDGKKILIDTGMGSAQSKLLSSLKRIDIQPEQIDYVLLTHLHGDHVAGLTVNGQPAFPNAEIWVSSPEKAFWFSEKTIEKNPSLKRNVDLAKSNLGPYGQKVKTFDFGERIVPGISTVNAVGHTPGHAGYLLESDTGKLLFWGDIVHSSALQFLYPEACATYDMDMRKATSSRRNLMTIAVRENLPVAGAHLPFPSIGRVGKAENGYTYHPGL